MRGTCASWCERAMVSLMRSLTMTLLLVSLAGAAEHPCVILKNHPRSVAEALSRWTPTKPYDYVEGDLPKGFKFHSEVGDKDVQKIKERGGKVVIIKPDYATAELEDARRQCKDEAGK